MSNELLGDADCNQPSVQNSRKDGFPFFVTQLRDLKHTSSVSCPMNINLFAINCLMNNSLHKMSDFKILQS